MTKKTEKGPTLEDIQSELANALDQGGYTPNSDKAETETEVRTARTVPEASPTREYITSVQPVYRDSAGGIHETIEAAQAEELALSRDRIIDAWRDLCVENKIYSRERAVQKALVLEEASKLMLNIPVLLEVLREMVKLQGTDSEGETE